MQGSDYTFQCHILIDIIANYHSTVNNNAKKSPQKMFLILSLLPSRL